ncbi:MAG: amidohydrolase family protein [Planctomycetota bacterium]|jgi:imidazolonepropionase-like amidohydrolase|nr:amidohydrolase family protein [Planctomycetota bacterium]MDP6763070.1 amidohydrolase family protein [Planctomycetota bacterium]MDP6989033.1 amidohydrolase family protein [Planctomycetota bacterium]
MSLAITITTVLVCAGDVEASSAPMTATGGQNLAVYADAVYTSTGKVIENGMVRVRDGKIRVVSKGEAGEGDVHVAAVTAGMIDLSGRISPSGDVEESNEITPHVRATDAIDFFSVSWARQLRSGVTTAMISPGDENVISGLCAVLKTGGPRTLSSRTLAADAALRGAFGSQPSRRNHAAFGRPTDFYSRRPTTRMGVEWEWRKAMYDAIAAAGDPARAFAGHERLMEVLRGELPLVVQAWTTQDIRTAVFLAEEMAAHVEGGVRLVIDAGAEAWKEPALLVRTKAAVILPPFDHDGRTSDGAFMAWNVAALLAEKGVPIALSSHNAGAAADRLAVQGAWARRGGLSFEDTLAAVTIAPARMVGVDERVGSIEVGKDGDLALWNGTPFEAGSRVVGVVLGGELVVDPRGEE